MKKLVAMAVPVAPGKTELWESFMNELQSKYKQQFADSRKKFGVRERTFIQKTPMGDLVLVTLEGEDPVKSFNDFTHGQDEFTKWFVEKVNEIHGMDIRVMNQEAMPTLVIDSEG
ncbi:hypothetical protein [Taibaiella soli]|uniref:Uncharacterized protein n=1 Tax=Taibaiella soli TaxID=1649169 RepID=A0A2W2B4S4_9BACT|nr:hypothetical protein [Taibaiella soli]PZF71219.1 hypothetical protein DN068_19800 [Taibaiella soli]